ncbi:MAG: ExeM/NucH family extracellular endonuclease [Casimicrobiaceae bacterium]|nr:ExeM/NucH family extracellular endonuclease [Casimicrobiaceae bacterium]
MSNAFWRARVTARVLCCLFAFLLALARADAQTTITEWTFTGDVTTPSTGSGTASLLPGNTATFAAGPSGVTGDRAWNTTNYPAQGTGSKTRGVQFQVSTAGYSNIGLRFDIRHSNTSANTIVVQYSTTGCSGTFTDAATFTATSGDSWFQRDVDLSSVTALNNNPNACFRVVSAFTPPGTTYVASNPSSSYSTTGTLRFDNVRVYSQPSTTDTPPSITAVTPANGATNVSVSTTIQLTFSEAVDVASGGISLVCAGTPQAFSGVPASNVTTLTLTPSAALPAGASCTLTVQANAVTDRDGSFDPMTADFSSSFTTGSAPNTPPTITADASFSPRLFLSATSPSYVSGVVNDPTDPARTVGIRFNLADHETPADSLTVTATSSNTAVVPASGLALSGSGSQRTLTITPAAAGTSTITVTVSDGSASTSYVIEYAASAASVAPSQSRFITGLCDASTAARIDGLAYVVANDEDQRLRLFPSTGSGTFTSQFDVTTALALTDISGGVPREVDIEASARLGNRIYWLASHSNSASGANRPNRSRVFATDVTGSGTSASLSFVGYYANLKADLIAWDNANGHGLGAGALGLAASAAAGVLPEAPGGDGFNIEGLTFAPDDTTAWIAFRAPLQNTTARNRALLIPVTNFTSLVTGSPGTGPANFGAPILLDLGGRSIRAIDRAADGRYLIVAGPHDAATGTAPKDFRLFRWSGNPADAPEMFLTNLTARGAAGSYEGIVSLPASLTAGQTVELLTDEGDTNFYGTGICKDLARNEWKKARVESFTLEGPVTRIHAVQGSGAASPLVGQTVTVEGIVTGDFQASGQLGGFFIQEPDALADGDPMTSEGIFVLHTATNVNVGDLVRVTGTVTEFTTGTGTRTELTSATVQVLSTGNPLPAPVTLNLPLPSMAHFEALEGMRVTIASPLTVSENYNLARYGELTLAPTRLTIPTDTIDPNDNPASGTNTSGTSNVPAVTAAFDLRERSRIILDDGSNVQNPPTIPYWDSTNNTLRVGSQVTSLTGVLSYGFSEYRIHPTAPVSFNFAPRPTTPPEVGGSLKVAGLNLWNYFNGDGAGGGFPTPRGATSLTEFNRQTAKTVAAINAMDAAVTALMEVENDGDGPTSAIKTLTDALNTAAGSPKWDYIRDPAGYTSLPGGNDQIKVAFLYQPARVTPIGAAQACNHSAFANARAPIAQLFESVANGGRFIAVVNHFKSKSTSTPPSGADIDQNDGQGAYNASRKAQATALVNCVNAWRASLNEDDVLLIGDFNAYFEEDPIDTFRAAGFTVLDKNGHSFIFDALSGSLDHAIVSASLQPQVTMARAWHINSDEPRILDYNLEFKGAGQSPDYYTPTPWRSSDHDPVLVGLDLAPDRAAVSVEAATVSEGATATITVRLSRPIARAASVSWRTTLASGDTASSGDFTSASGTLNFPAGQTTATVSVDTLQDALIEGAETFTVELFNPSPELSLGASSAQVTINDDDVAETVTISVNPTSVSEASGTPIVFTVARSGGSPAQQAQALVVNLTPPASSSRYTTSCGSTITIAANATSATCTVTPTDNALVDGPVTVTVALAAGSGYTLGTPNSASATITDDEGPQTVTISANPTSVSEASGTPIVFTVTRSGGSPAQQAQALVVNLTPPASSSRYTTSCGSTITIAANATSATCTVTPTDNALVDGPVTVAVALAAGSGYTLGTTTSASATITDNDVALRTLSALSLPGGSATASARFSAQNGCGVEVIAARFVALGSSTLFTPAPISAPAGQSLPWGVFELELATCPGGTVEVELSMPGALSGAWKWGYASSTAPAPSWFALPGATLVGGTLRFALTDGGSLDNDRLTNGRIVDPLGLAALTSTEAAQPIPSAATPVLLLLALMLGLLGVSRLRAAR